MVKCKITSVFFDIIGEILKATDVAKLPLKRRNKFVFNEFLNRLAFCLTNLSMCDFILLCYRMISTSLNLITFYDHYIILLYTFANFMSENTILIFTISIYFFFLSYSEKIRIHLYISIYLFSRRVVNHV